MIKLTKICIDKIEAYETLKTIVKSPSIDDTVIKILQNNIGLRCDEIIIEYPYYDSDYLSTFYIHYSQKLRGYEKLCYRLHVLKNGDYYGYIVLRPTIAGPKLGRTLIEPQILIKETAYLMSGSFTAHIAGNRMEIKCFPWKSQETDISVCAHTAAWTVLRYFGNKFKNYPDTTIGHIVDAVSNEWGRKTPSIGLNPVQVSDIFKSFGFSPLILQREKSEEDVFDDEVMSYIESGLPMVGFLYPRRHAISIMGHGQINKEILDNDDLVKQIIDPKTKIVSHSKLVDGFYVMDDNYFPYKKMPMGLADRNSDIQYGSSELRYCVVPLYSRMQLGYNEVCARLKTWMIERAMNWDRPCVSRIYITTANSLKREALNSKDMNKTLVDIIVNLSLSRFVWCIDLANFAEYKGELTSGRILIDTTAPTLDEEPWLLRHDRDKIEYVDVEDDTSHSRYNVANVRIAPYKMYKNNLTETESVFKEDITQ